VNEVNRVRRRGYIKHRHSFLHDKKIEINDDLYNRLRLSWNNC